MDLGEVLAKFDEKVKPLVTALTRRRIVAELDDVALSGSLPEIEFLSKLWPIDIMQPPPSIREGTMDAYILRHRFMNDDLSNKDVLEALDIYNCSQTQFFRLLEAIVDPITREIPEQYDSCCAPKSAISRMTAFTSKKRAACLAVRFSGCAILEKVGLLQPIVKFQKPCWIQS